MCLQSYTIANTNANNSSHQDQTLKKQAVAVTTPPTGMCLMIFFVRYGHQSLFNTFPMTRKGKEKGGQVC